VRTILEADREDAAIGAAADRANLRGAAEGGRVVPATPNDWSRRTVVVVTRQGKLAMRLAAYKELADCRAKS